MKRLAVATFDSGDHFEDFFSGTDKILPGKLDPAIYGCLLLHGGADMSPFYYGEDANVYSQAQNWPSERDEREWTLIQEAVEKRIPIIGICLGAQRICCFMGGKLIQHVDGHGGGHFIETVDGKVVWAKAEHHQMMVPSGDYEVIAWPKGGKLATKYLGEKGLPVQLPDNFIEPEIVWWPSIKALGIQPHPEWMLGNTPFVEYTLKLVKERILNDK